MDVSQLCKDVTLELTEMKKLGFKIPARALKLAKSEEFMADYSDGSMSISETADLLIEVA